MFTAYAPSQAKLWKDGKMFRAIEANCWSPEARLRECDETNVTVQVWYPVSNFFGATFERFFLSVYVITGAVDSACDVQLLGQTRRLFGNLEIPQQSPRRGLPPKSDSIHWFVLNSLHHELHFPSKQWNMSTFFKTQFLRWNWIHSISRALDCLMASVSRWIHGKHSFKWHQLTHLLWTGLGTIPLQSPELAVRELERCMTELNLAGIQIGSHVNDWTLDRPELAPVFEAGLGLGLVLFFFDDLNSSCEFQWSLGQMFVCWALWVYISNTFHVLFVDIFQRSDWTLPSLFTRGTWWARNWCKSIGCHGADAFFLFQHPSHLKKCIEFSTMSMSHTSCDLSILSCMVWLAPLNHLSSFIFMFQSFFLLIIFAQVGWHASWDLSGDLFDDFRRRVWEISASARLLCSWWRLVPRHHR